MKRVLFSRHAKSDWGEPSLDDHDRPLNRRGERDAPEMGKRLAERNLRIQRIITSSALRALQTAERVGNELDFSVQNLAIEPRLYLASVKNMMAILQELPDELDTVALFAHNPGMTDAADTFTDFNVGNLPTCGMFMVEFDSDEWKTIPKAKRNSVFLDYPKM